jgi:hypothetical protein
VPKLVEAPPTDTLEGVRDRPILATLLYHAIRREELCGLKSAICKAVGASAMIQIRIDPKTEAIA